MPQTQSNTTQAPRTTRRRAIARLLVLVSIPAVLIAVGAAMNIGERFVYFPTREPFDTPAGFDDVTFQNKSGHTLHAWFLPAKGAQPGEILPAVLHAHGNAGNVSLHSSFSSFLTNRALHVLVFDYRGYGRSDDAPINRRALLEDTQAALAYLRTRSDVDPDRIGLYGVSLGGVPALHAAAQDPRVPAVATLSAFSSWKTVAADHAPIVGSLLIRAGLDPVDAVRQLAPRPLLLVHGDADAIVRRHHMARLETAASEAGVPVTTHTARGADHNDLIFTHPAASEAIADFFVEHLNSPPGP